jgi:hypothetical protein
MHIYKYKFNFILIKIRIKNLNFIQIIVYNLLYHSQWSYVEQFVLYLHFKRYNVHFLSKLWIEGVKVHH